MTQIKFGTDGWRAIIADQYTFENVALVSRATAQWLRKNYGDRPKAVIGHDTRFMGRAFSELSARVLASEGVRVLFASDVATTPAISWATRAFDCDAGVVITASHNPPEYSGFKIKANFGGPASPEMIAAVEQELASLAPAAEAPRPFADLVEEGVIEVRDLNAEYLEMVRGLLDIEAIKASGIKVAHDAMYGAGRGMIAALLGQERVVELRSALNPGFGGKAPEPIERNLKDLAETVVREGCAVGLANDGDADRIGMFDERGEFVDSHQMLALLVKYLHTERGLTGDVVKTYSTTHMLDKMGAAYGLNVVTTAIGFKYIGQRIVEGDVLVGGEESGGMAVKGHIPERDGVYIGLLIVEMMVKRGKKLSELVHELYDEFGVHICRRTDVHTTNERKQAVLDRLTQQGITTLQGRPVQDYGTMDGFKLTTDGGWLLVRASGTEPVLRIYSEADSAEAAEGILSDAVAQLGLEGEGH